MITSIVERLHRVAAGWKSEAEERRGRTANDPGADALVSCANDLEAAAKELAESVTTLTPEQFAELHHVTPQSVTRWCRVGLLTAERKPSGWAIPADAQPPMLRNLSKTG